MRNISLETERKPCFGVAEKSKITSTMKILPETRIIVLTSFIDDEKVYPVIEAGAFSYLLNTSSATEIADSIRSAAKGEPVVEAKVTNKKMQRMRGAKEKYLHDSLTPREREVLPLLDLDLVVLNPLKFQSLMLFSMSYPPDSCYDVKRI